MATAAANAVAACPEGNDADEGTTPTGSSPGSATGGRARSKTSFSSVTSSAAVVIASAAAAAARGKHLRFASHAQPTAAINGHFTNHVDASRKTAVSGPQRTSSPNADAALSKARSVSSSSATADQDTGRSRARPRRFTVEAIVV